MKKILTILLAAISLMAASCSPKLHLQPDFLTKPSAWPYFRGDVEARGVWSDSVAFSGKMEPAWEAKISYKPSAPLTLYHDNLVIPSTGKRVLFFDAASGLSRGQLKLQAPGQTAVLMHDSILVIGLGPNANRLENINLLVHKTRWRAPVKDITSSPIIVNDRLVISSSGGTVSALDPKTGHRLWLFTGEGKFIAPLSYGDGRIFQPTDKGVLYAISESDGKELYHVQLEGPLVTAAVITDIVFVASTTGNLYALRAADGGILWQTHLAGPVWGAPAVTDNAVIIGHSGGEVLALNRHDGTQIWHFPAIEVIKASPLVVGQYVVVGSMGGKLWVLNRDSGEPIVQKELIGAIAYPPVTDGARVYVATQSGRIYCYGEHHEQPGPQRQ